MSLIKGKPCLCLLILFCVSLATKAQTEKKVNTHSLFWLGSVNTIRFNEHWGLIADFHYRTYDFLANPYSYFTRGLANYYFNENVSAGFGYGHIWSGALTPEPHPYSNENRITEQVQLTSKKGKFSIAQRWRLEQRWQQKIVNNEKTTDYRFTDRVRYALSFIYSPFKDKMLPSFTNYEELMVQFGKEVVYNTFDQARISFGVRQPITPHLNADINYMYVYQQQFSGNQYLQGNTLRLYINYNVGWQKNNNKQKDKTALVQEGDE